MKNFLLFFLTAALCRSLVCYGEKEPEYANEAPNYTIS